MESRVRLSVRLCDNIWQKKSKVSDRFETNLAEYFSAGSYSQCAFLLDLTFEKSLNPNRGDRFPLHYGNEFF